jgi:tetratricopeptide (TPR) repeat protein
MAKKKKNKKGKEIVEQNPAPLPKKPQSKLRRYGPLTYGEKGLSLAILIGLSMLLYFKSLDFGYVLDDKLVYTENDFVTAGSGGLKKILLTESFTGYFGEEKNLVQGSRYRPLSLISYNLENQVFGTKGTQKNLDPNPDKKSTALTQGLDYIAPNATASHAINILLYALCGWLILLTMRRLINRKSNDKEKWFWGLAFLTAVIYIVHPLHVEAVANVKGRDEILSLLLSMATFLSALKYVDTHKTGWLLSAALLFFLGLLAKENTLTFLAIIPFGLMLFRKGIGQKNLLVFGVLLTATILYLVLRFQVIGFLIDEAPSTDIMNNSFAGMTGVEKYGTIFYTLLYYLKLNIIPYPLTHDYYPYHIPISTFGDWQVLLSIFLHIGLLGLMFYSWKKNKLITFAIGYYFAAMSIVSNIVISLGTFMNERFAFAASLATCLLLAKGILYLKDKNHKLLATILTGLILVAYSLITLNRVPVWESELALNSAAIKVSKNSARSNSFMATALFNEYKTTQDNATKLSLLQRAEPYAEKAIEIHPTYYNGNLMKVGIAAELHKMNRQLDPLLNTFLEAGTIRPDIGFLKQYLEYINDREDKNKMLGFYADLANGLINQHQRYDWAISYLQMAMQIDPNDPEIRRLIRKAYIGLGRPQEAENYR